MFKRILKTIADRLGISAAKPAAQVKKTAASVPPPVKKMDSKSPHRGQSPEKPVSPLREKRTDERPKRESRPPRSASGSPRRETSSVRESRPERSPRNSSPRRASGEELLTYEPLKTPPMPVLTPGETEEGKLRFHDLTIRPELIAATQDLGFKFCSPVQALAIPQLLEHRDIIGKAQTGTGKTAAFLISMFNRFLLDPKPIRRPGTCRALVLAPTRELAIQIHKDAESLGKYCGFHNLVVFGGMDHHKQMEAICSQGLDILIGTPGRLLDYIRGRQLRLEDTEVLVIDEADRMLDMGFIPDVTRIVGHLPGPGIRQTLFFSATFTPEVMRLADRWLKDPFKVEIESENVVTDLITQRFYSVLRDDKFKLLCWILRHEPFTRILVFGNRRDFNSELARKLQKAGIECELLSGDVPQEKRIKVLERFRSGKTPVLVATDVAARGIHVDGISHVINYDLPEQAEDYVHRIGRTGRAGVPGTAISFICEYGAYAIEGIEALIGNPIVSIQPESEMLSGRES